MDPSEHIFEIIGLLFAAGVGYYFSIKAFIEKKTYKVSEYTYDFSDPKLKVKGNHAIIVGLLYLFLSIVFTIILLMIIFRSDNPYLFTGAVASTGVIIIILTYYFYFKEKRNGRH